MALAVASSSSVFKSVHEEALAVDSSSNWRERFERGRHVNLNEVVDKHQPPFPPGRPRCKSPAVSPGALPADTESE